MKPKSLFSWVTITPTVGTFLGGTSFLSAVAVLGVLSFYGPIHWDKVWIFPAFLLIPLFIALISEKAELSESRAASSDYSSDSSALVAAREIILTVDGRGKAAKIQALKEIERIAYKRGARREAL